MQNLKEGTKIFLPIGVIITFIFAALAFVRNGDIERLNQDEITLREHSASINQINIEQQKLQSQEDEQIKVLEEVRLDVKQLLEQGRTREANK